MYGENTSLIRTQLSTLLRQHRIQQRIGGAGMHSVPVMTTAAEREDIGRLIQRYRHGVLTWCHQALTSAGPSVYPTRPGEAAAPDVDLRRRLERILTRSTATLPTTAELTTPDEYALVDAWRLAARAAALGEHDLAGDLAPGRLDINERLAIVKDTAEVIRGLVVLDRRYRNIPGWQLLPDRVRLERAAEACAFLTTDDYTIDHRGWRPSATTIDGPPQSGISGVIQAEHNLLVHLSRFPNALNFQRLLDSQRELSAELAERVAAAEPDLAAAWRRRAAKYDRLHREARNIGGHVGTGGRAAAEAANAVSRLRRLPPDPALNDKALRDLSTLFDRVDQRLGDVFEHGARERLYFARVAIPRIVDTDGQMTHAVRTRYLPITSPVRTDLLRLVREQLCPQPDTPCAPPGARDSRVELSQALTHRPPSRARELGL